MPVASVAGARSLVTGARAPASYVGTVRRTAWVATALLGGLQAFSRRHVVSADGLSYLDVAEAYARGDWATAVNGYWSPLYSWILVPVTEWLPGPAYWEATLVHAVNFGFLLAALAALDFLLSSLERAVPTLRGEGGVPRWVWRGFAYAVFLWSALELVGVWVTTPDLAVEALVFLAVGLLFRVRAGAPLGRTSALLGAVVGVGYLTKAILGPIGLLVLALLALEAGGSWARRLKSVGAAAAVATVVAGPFVVALSLDEGRPTTGETGRLAYAWYVNGVRRFTHWQGEGPGAGTPVHPTRRLMTGPEVFEFAEPLEVSYPPWYDPPYWHEGLELALRPGRQASVLVANLKLYLVMAPWLLVLPLGLLFARGRTWARRTWRHGRPMLVVGGTGLLAYALIHVENRLVAPFVVLPTLALLPGIHEEVRAARAWVRGLCLGVAAVATLFAVDGVLDVAMDRQSGHAQWRVAEAVRAAGAEPGAAVAVVGVRQAYWARRADVRIVAEVPRQEGSAYWSAEPGRRAEVRRALREAGARVIIARLPPDSAPHAGWERVPGTPYVLRSLAADGGPGP